MSYSRIQQFSIVFAFIMITWGLLPFFNLDNTFLTSNTIASSTILFLIGIAYPLIVFKPQWNKAVLMIEGIVFAAVGLAFLQPLYNLIFLIIGAFFAILAILAYAKKLPSRLLKFFYKTPK
ncbi:hypothetical protein KQY27_00025 [Methanobrevibacter sp. TMH8]|uniref:hypothetical protein n=1 Tax=Methanobrevibacter sp. TMH8 TaxID=2848611 RepID=UPI001CCBC66B|nr:hypothetical protein [Methanobrevibacter sp. TMH8]MBZ9569944.1 hypothetical protein [Methanobrevibacter sp. TMH8]